MIRTKKFQVNEERPFSVARRVCKRMAGVAFLLCGLLSLDAGVASAMQFELDDDTKLDIDVSLTYSAAWRAKDQDSELLNPLTSGNRNFDKGDMINNRYSALVDIDFQHKDYGLFVRPRDYYDFAYEGSDFTDKTQDLHRDKTEILDAFAYGLFELGDRSVNLRVGKQVVSWGESLFILNGVSAAMSPIDGTAANVPGIELKDLFLPVGQVLAEISLLDNLTFSSFYQWEWDKSRLDEAGSFFNTNDLVDDAIRDTPLGALRAGDDDPDDDGQWGVALRYVAEELNGTEFGLYYINYHEKLPLLRDLDLLLATNFGHTYYLDYDDNVHLYGASVSTIVGDTNVAVEVSYRDGLSVPVESALTPLLFGYKEVEVIQAQFSTITIMPQAPIYSNMQVTTEFGINNVTGGLDGKKLYNDRTAWGGVVKAQFDYYQIMENLDLQIPITYKFNPDGVSSVQGTFSEKADSLGVSFDFTYKAVYKMGLGYTAALGDPEDNAKADRDFYSLNLKYTF